MKKRQKKKNDKNLQFRTVTLKHGFYRHRKFIFKKLHENALWVSHFGNYSIYSYWDYYHSEYPNRFRINKWINEEMKMMLPMKSNKVRIKEGLNWSGNDIEAYPKRRY